MGESAGRWLPTAILAVMALEVVEQLTGADWAAAGAFIAMGAVVVTAFRHWGLREGYLMALSAVLTLLLWQTHPDPLPVTWQALAQAVFLMGFLFCISLLQEAAMTSRSVADLGFYLARQPGGRRFVALYGGTQVMTVVFNLGALSLLAPLIRRGAEMARDDPLTPVREQRQLNAVLRGFAWVVVWAPTAIAPLALMELLPGIDRPRWIAMGLGLAALMLCLGWVEDRIVWRGYSAAARGLPTPVPPRLPARALWRFLAVALALAAVTVAVIATFGLGVPGALMSAAPVIMLVWLRVQGIPMASRLREIAAEGLPASAPAAITLGAAGYVAITAAALIPAEAAADWIGLDAVPPWIFMLGLTLGVVLLSQFGLSPIMMSVFFGALLARLPVLPIDPTLAALALSAGWAAASTISPYAAGVIYLARVTGHSGARLTYRWNARFCALSLAVLTAVYVVIA